MISLTLDEIVSGLQKGGLATTAKNFRRTVNATLYRLKETKELLQFEDGWDLATSYPDSFVQRLTGDSKTNKTKKTKVKRR